MFIIKVICVGVVASNAELDKVIWWRPRSLAEERIMSVNALRVRLKKFGRGSDNKKADKQSSKSAAKGDGGKRKASCPADQSKVATASPQVASSLVIHLVHDLALAVPIIGTVNDIDDYHVIYNNYVLYTGQEWLGSYRPHMHSCSTSIHPVMAYSSDGFYQEGYDGEYFVIVNRYTAMVT